MKLHFVDNIDDAFEMMRWLGSRDVQDVMGTDTETTGLVIGQDRVKLAQLGGREHGWAIPWHSWNGLYKEAISKYEGSILMHNAKFDAGMLDHQGETSVHVPRHRIKDTRIMSHVLEPHMSTALKNQAARHVDASAAGLQADLRKTAWTFATVPVDYEPYWTYGALDPVLTVQLYDHHWPIIEADKGSYDAFELENAYQWVAEKMERNGVFIDKAYTQEQYDKFTAYVQQAEKWVWENYKVKPGSNASIVAILQEAGFTFTKATAAGAVALDKEVLGGIDHPLAQTVLKRRQLQKLASTYLLHYLTELDDDDLIHPSINTLGARTSRMSMERPNFQNLPRKSQSNPAATTVRNCVRTRYYEDGGSLLMCDFDQIEMRLLAHFSEDEGLIAAFHSPDDFFVSLARNIYADDTIIKSDPRRQLTKNTGYANIYGAGVRKAAQTAGVSEEAMAVSMKGFHTLYPRVKVFQNAVEQAAWRRQKSEGVGYARTALTRRKMVADLNKVYALVNYLIQGSAAEVFKEKQLQLDAAGLGKYMMVPVHDEIILDVSKDYREDAITTLRDIMNDTTTFRVPITASVSEGARWGEKVELEL